MRVHEHDPAGRVARGRRCRSPATLAAVAVRHRMTSGCGIARRSARRAGGRARHHGRMEYPELAARTRRFTYGAPARGDRRRRRRPGGLPALAPAPRTRRPALRLRRGDRRRSGWSPTRRAARRTDRAELPAGRAGAARADPAVRRRHRLVRHRPLATVAAFTLGGRLYRADLRHRRGRPCVRVRSAGAIDPRPDPTGRRIAYVSTADRTAPRCGSPSDRPATP